MNTEHKDILKEKRDQEKKVILITVFTVLVVALLVLAAFFFLPDKRETPPADTNQSDNLSNVNSNTDSKAEGSQVNNNEDSVPADISDPTVSNDTSRPGDVSSDTSDPSSIKHGWVINNLGYTYLYGNSGFEQFNATEATKQRFVTTINDLAKTLSSDVKIYSILAPTSVEFASIPREIYSADNFFNSSQKNTISQINEKLDKRITAVNVFDTLSSHKEEYLYFRTDINWTSLAAYYAYADFAKSAGFDAVKLGDYNKMSYESFLGRFYSATGEESLSKTPDTIEYYQLDEDNKCSLKVYKGGITYSNYKLVGNNVSASANGYNVFLGMEAERYVINTDANNGKKILVVADTSGATFVPYLVKSYSEIHYVNPNYFKQNLNEYIKNNSIGEVLFLNYTTSASRSQYTTVLSQLGGAN